MATIRGQHLFFSRAAFIFLRAAFILFRISDCAATIQAWHLFCSELLIMRLLFKGGDYAWQCLIKAIRYLYVTCGVVVVSVMFSPSRPFAFPPQEPATISRSGSSGSNISDASQGSRELLQEGSSGHLYVVTPERHHTVGSSDMESSFPGR